jgi:hypothetical protein
MTIEDEEREEIRRAYFLGRKSRGQSAKERGRSRRVVSQSIDGEERERKAREKKEHAV